MTFVNSDSERPSVSSRGRELGTTEGTLVEFSRMLAVELAKRFSPEVREIARTRPRWPKGRGI